MIWLNPWAWAGLATIAVPVLIHLLGRGHARVQRFPTLRFLDASRLLPTRRTRVHDLLLLAIRVCILLAAVAALAQPYWLTSRRKQTLDVSLARAIVIDTSASMHRIADSARRQAKRIADSAQTSVILQTNDPSRAVAGAVAWLGTQPSRGEVVILSDFQAGSMSASDLAIVPRSVGIRLIRVRETASTQIERRVRSGNAETIARATLSPERTDVEWTRSPTAAAREPELLAASADQPALDAAVQAARSAGVLVPPDGVDRGGPARAIAIVYPTFAQRAVLLHSATPLRTPWMADVAARVHADSLLIDATAAVVFGAAPAMDSGGVVIARRSSGQPAVVAAQDHDRLLFFALTDASSLTSAALIAATTRALSTSAPLSELNPEATPDNVLASWQRAPSAEAPPNASRTATSDGRWLWLLALILLGVETWARRPVIATATVRSALATDRSHAA